VDARREFCFDRKMRIAHRAATAYAFNIMTTNAILNLTQATEMAHRNQSRDETDQNPQWQAVVARDANHDGKFVFAVSSTGVYCRPSCPARRPRPENVTFFREPDQAEKAGYRACLRCRPRAIGGNGTTETVKAMCRYIEQHLDEPLTLARLGSEFHQSPFHLQRTFKSVLGISPRAYADSCRMNQLKDNLRAGHSVTRSMYDAGYSSSSRLYERTASQLGMTPDKYRRGAIAAPIRYTFADSPMGRMLIAATDKGICAIQFANSDDELEQGLRHEFPFAIRRRDDDAMEAWKKNLLRQMRGQRLNASLPLDIQATAFQRRVWAQLQSIPFGATRSYAAVAKAIGQPTATRAVARACATNPVAVAIPCHRVVRKSGDMGGYRWGVDRKKALLEFEMKQA
jgi:AraC family transcriptional regulator of adaptative response/methylated-DNA-[protein]-cysteine methyltransferase